MSGTTNDDPLHGRHGTKPRGLFLLALISERPKPRQFGKVPTENELPELTIVTEVRLLHPTKASSAIKLTEPGIVTEVKLAHPKKALSLIVVTESPMATDARLVHPAKA